MNSGRVICLAILPVLVVLGCALPGVSPVQTAAVAAVPSSGGSFSVSTDSSRNIGVLTTPSGTRIDIQAVEQDGTVVSCASATSVTQIADETPAGGSSAKGLGSWTVLVTGSRADGKPGAWIVSSNRTVQPLISDKSGQLSSCLPDSDDEDGVFRGVFGWVYRVMGTSENGKLIAGYAESTRDITRGHIKIEKGTTIGVYWRVWKHAWRPYHAVSQARVIGLLDTSKFPTRNERVRRWLEWASRHLVPGLRLFLFDYLSSYLTMVDKDGVHYDSVNDLYYVSGLDQEKLPAVATIDATHIISIVETTPPASSVDLAPGQLTAASGSAADGGTLSVTLTLNNLQSGSVSTAFSVDFYLAQTSAFNPSTDAKVGTATVSSGPAGGASIAVPASLSIPAGALNQDVYLYAVVDAAGAVTETDKTNNTSTVGNAAVVLVYDGANSGRTYGVLLESYAPSGSGTVNTVMALYDGTGTFLEAVNNASMGGYAVIDRTGSPLGSGTYYVLVTSWADGPYAMAVRTSGIDRKSFTPLANKAADPYGVNDNPHVFPVTQNLPSLPSPVVSMPVGSMVNRYAVQNSDDWFTFTLP